MSEVRSATLVAVGDIMIGDSAQCVGWGFASATSKRGLEAAFQDVRYVWKNADMLFGNLETVISSEGVGQDRRAREQMRVGLHTGSLLRDMGFTVLSVANNHANQHADAGFRSTVDALEEAGIATAGLRGTDGWGCEPSYVHANGLSVMFLAYSWRPNQYGLGAPVYASCDLGAVLADVKRGAASNDCVVVSLHWGDEFVNQPSCEQVIAGRAIIDAGAALVIGHHPHVRQPVEQYGHGVIAYSLGNLVSDMLWLPECAKGQILTVELSPGCARVEQSIGVYTDNEYKLSVLEERTPPLAGDGIEMVAYSKQVTMMLRRQRAMAYRYIALNILKFDIDVLWSLFSQTIKNKFSRWAHS